MMYNTVRLLSIFKLPQRHKEYFARKLMGYSNEQMYEVVADVKNYKKFLPFCTKSTILDHKDNILHANLEVGFPPVVENYTSKVTLVKFKSVNAVCRDGLLFDYLQTNWTFAPGLKSNPQSCIVDFYVKFQFRSMLHSQLANLFFEGVVSQMEAAFVNEARRRFGKESLECHVLSNVRC